MVKGQISPKPANAGGGHQLLYSQVAEYLKQPLVCIAHKVDELICSEETKSARDDWWFHPFRTRPIYQRNSELLLTTVNRDRLAHIPGRWLIR